MPTGEVISHTPRRQKLRRCRTVDNGNTNDALMDSINCTVPVKGSVGSNCDNDSFIQAEAMRSFGEESRMLARPIQSLLTLPLMILFVSILTGCASSNVGNRHAQFDHVPRELRKISQPNYVIEPPDILLIETVNHLRRAGS